MKCRTIISGVSATLIALSNVTNAQPGRAFTYQGQLIRSGAPVNNTCDLQFALFDEPEGGTQKGMTNTLPGVVVNNGLFTALLDFGNEFDGAPRYVESAVRCGAEATFTTLQPRQAVTATPYALSLRPGAKISGDSDTGITLELENTNLTESAALQATSTKDTGSATAIVGQIYSPDGVAVAGIAYDGGAGVIGQSASGVAVLGLSGGTAAVQGYNLNPDGAGVLGEADGANAAGVFGRNADGPGVWGRATGSGPGTYGESNGIGVRGLGFTGVSGQGANAGVVGEGFFGVAGHATGVDAQAIRGDNDGSNTVGYAGLFLGRVSIFGTLFKQGGAFKIDHPLDPSGKYLSHSLVESPDMKNLYDGVVTLDADGGASVELPAWFEALNRDFRYQLTCIGGHAPVFIAEEIKDNRFRIAGGHEGLKVSWLVTGTRHDPYAEENRIRVEEDKPETEKGFYAYPEGYGMPRSMGLSTMLTGDRMDALKAEVPTKGN